MQYPCQVVNRFRWPHERTTVTKVYDSAQLDPNHSHFILAKGNQWGDETEILFEVIKTFEGNIRIVAILVGGGEISKKEILMSVNNGWPVIVIESGGHPILTFSH